MKRTNLEPMRRQAPRSIGVTGATPLALRFAALADDAGYGEPLPRETVALIVLPTTNTERVA